ncbi:Prolyl oligopeptidase family protein, partial [Rhizobium mongolense subsp. loessense]
TMYGISNLLEIGAGFPDEIAKVHQSPAVTEALLVNGTAFADFPGASIGSNPEKALQASPMGHVEGRKPPFLIMHGSADKLVSPRQSVQLYEALKNRGEKVEYVLVEHAGHSDLTWYQPPIIDRVVEWFKGVLGEPIKGDGNTPVPNGGNLLKDSGRILRNNAGLRPMPSVSGAFSSLFFFGSSHLPLNVGRHFFQYLSFATVAPLPSIR